MQRVGEGMGRTGEAISSGTAQGTGRSGKPGRRAAQLAQQLARGVMNHQAAWIIIIFIAIYAAFSIARPDAFLTSVNNRSMAATASEICILALGETFVMITAGIDLSVGSVLVFSSVVAAKYLQVTGGQNASVGAVVIAAIIAIVGGMAWGLLNGVLVAKAKVPALIVTLGTFGAALGVSQIITNGVDIGDIPANTMATVGYGNAFGGVEWIVVIAVALILIAGYLLALTRFGRYTYAIGSNLDGARRVGINVDRHLLKVYTLSGLCAGIAGFLDLSRYGTTTISGHLIDNLTVITAIVLGGTSLFGGRGSITGTVAGVLIPVVLASGLVIIGVQTYWQNVAVAIVLVAAVYVDQLRRRYRGD